MSRLDEKLKAVWLEPEGCTLNAVADQKALEDIKQVFERQGWMKPSDIMSNPPNSDWTDVQQDYIENSEQS